MRAPLRLFLLILSATATLAIPATASAATPFTAGTGSNPAVAVGPDGSGHVVWNAEGSNAPVGYCRVGPGSESCNLTHTLTVDGFPGAGHGGRANIFVPATNTVVVVSSCFNCGGAAENVNVWVSTDNGAIFTPSQQYGSELGLTGFGAWLDDEGIFVGIAGSRVKANSTPPVLGNGIRLTDEILYTYTPEVARLPGEDKLVAVSNNLADERYAVYDGALTTTGINTEASWERNLTFPSPAADVEETALNAGPNGINLTYLDGKRVALRHFDPSTNRFGPAAYVDPEEPIDDNSVSLPDSYQDLAGRVHVMWRTLYDGNRLRYRVSDGTGANFGPTGNLAVKEQFLDPEIGVGPGNDGFATWVHSGSVRVVPLDPQPEPSGPPTPPGGTTPPTVTQPRIGDRTLRPGQRTTFTFRSNVAGQASLTFEKRYKGLKGKRKGKRACLPATRKRLRALRRKAKTAKAFRKLRRKRTCRAFRRIGQIRQQVQPGLNTIRFNGRVAGRRLGPGTYRAKLVITNAAGVVSRTETLRFTVKKPKKKGKKRKRGRRHARR